MWCNNKDLSVPLKTLCQTRSWLISKTQLCLGIMYGERFIVYHGKIRNLLSFEDYSMLIVSSQAKHKRDS